MIQTTSSNFNHLIRPTVSPDSIKQINGLEDAGVFCLSSNLCGRIKAVWQLFCDLLYLIWNKVKSYCPCIFRRAYPIFQTDLSVENVRKTYWGLGHKKWMECVDGCDHKHGKEVFDKGLHGKTIEPGYLAGMEKGFQFVSDTLNQRITPEWFLKLHNQTCGHFKGAANGTLMGPEKVGVFRDTTDYIRCSYDHNSNYAMLAEAREEFNAADLGTLTDDGTQITLTYKVMSGKEVRARFEEYTDQFYNEIAAAKSSDGKLVAICKYVKYLDWLHPPRDGSGRTVIFGILNKILSENGFHPVLLEYPYITDCVSLQKWTEYVKEGLLAWEAAKPHSGGWAGR